MAASTIPPLSFWPCGTLFGNAQEELQNRYLEGSGSQTDPLTPWYNVRAGIIPFRYSPRLLGGKGTSHIGWETGELTSKGKKIRVSHLAPHPAHAFPTAERLVVVVS